MNFGTNWAFQKVNFGIKRIWTNFGTFLSNFGILDIFKIFRFEWYLCLVILDLEAKFVLLSGFILGAVWFENIGGSMVRTAISVSAAEIAIFGAIFGLFDHPKKSQMMLRIWGFQKGATIEASLKNGEVTILASVCYIWPWRAHQARLLEIRLVSNWSAVCVWHLWLKRVFPHL